MVAHITYANNLISKGHGYPLWEPDPGEYAPVEIADVGYLWEGAFVKLFNPSKDEDDRSNRLGFPAGHTQFHVGDIWNKMPLPKRPKYILSTGVAEIDANVTATAGTFVQVGGGFSLASSHQQGAVLTMGEVAYRQDALDKGRFLQYIIKHHRSWLNFANTLGRGLSLTDILFITGCDKTSDWACAAWSERTTSVTLRFIADLPGIAQGSATLWGKWESSQSVDENVGPQRPTPSSEPLPPALAPTSSNISSIDDAMIIDESAGSSTYTTAPSPMPPRDFNQCVFLRGFRMGDRSSWLRRRTIVDVGDGFMTVRKPLDLKKPEQAPKPHDRDQKSLLPTVMGGSSQGSALQDTNLHRSDGSGDDGWSTDSDDGAKKLRETPTEAMIDFIFENSRCDLALIHDEDISHLLQEQDVRGFCDYTSWIRALCPSIHPEGNVAMFEPSFQMLRMSNGYDRDQPTSSPSREVHGSDGKTGLPPTSPSRVESSSKFAHEEKQPVAKSGAISVTRATIIKTNIEPFHGEQFSARLNNYFQKSPISLTTKEIAPCRCNSMMWTVSYVVLGEVKGTASARTYLIAKEAAAKLTLEALGQHM